MSSKLADLKRQRKKEEPPCLATLGSYQALTPLDRYPDLVSHLQETERIMQIGETYSTWCTHKGGSGVSTIADVLDAYYDPRRKSRHSMANVIRQKERVGGDTVTSIMQAVGEY